MLGTEILSGFESLGDDCEFGSVQQLAGLDPISLLRWAGCSLNGLVRALEADFADIYTLDDIRPSPPGQVLDVKYDIYMHSDLAFEGEFLRREPSNLTAHARMLRGIRFRLRLFHETLATGRKIFVFKSTPPLSTLDMLRLKSALDLRGPQKLLCVVGAAPDHPPASVELIASGLMLAGLPGPPADLSRPETINIEAWRTLCTAAAQSDWGHAYAVRSAPIDRPSPGLSPAQLAEQGWKHMTKHVLSTGAPARPSSP